MDLMNTLPLLLLGLSIGTGIAVGLGLQGYFLYKIVSQVTVLKAAPNVKAVKELTPTKKEKPKKKEEDVVMYSADNLSSEALNNLRKRI